MCEKEVVPELLHECMCAETGDTVEVKCTSYKFRTMAACLTMSAAQAQQHYQKGKGGRRCGWSGTTLSSCLTRLKFLQKLLPVIGQLVSFLRQRVTKLLILKLLS